MSVWRMLVVDGRTRPVECFEEYDANADAVRVVRGDTGEIVSVRVATPCDRQLELWTIERSRDWRSVPGPRRRS